MALLRKLFYRKPPDGLLEISERVYVFDCCFSTEVWDEKNYKGYVGDVIRELREYYPEPSILVFNFRDAEWQSRMASALSEYEMTIMDYPRHYEGCPLLPMEVIHHFLRSSESWLSLGQQNLLIMHCERGGWPVLAFMLAALLIYRKQYNGEQKTLDMVYKQAPKELLHVLAPLNPMPSQLRYLQYISRRNLVPQWPPLDRALSLDCVIIRMIPNIEGGGCRPLFRIFGPDPALVGDRTPKVLFSTPKKSKAVRYYKQAECELVKIDINCNIQGDVVLECTSLCDDMEREKMIFRAMFNTAFIRSNILMLNRDEIDTLWDAKEQFPRDFRAEVLFSEMDAAASVVPINMSCFEEKEGLPEEAFAKVNEIFNSVDWLVPKAEAALTMIQQVAAANAAREMLAPQATEISTLEQERANEKIQEKVNEIDKSSLQLESNDLSSSPTSSFLDENVNKVTTESPSLEASSVTGKQGQPLVFPSEPWGVAAEKSKVTTSPFPSSLSSPNYLSKSKTVHVTPLDEPCMNVHESGKITVPTVSVTETTSTEFITTLPPPKEAPIDSNRPLSPASAPSLPITPPTEKTGNRTAQSPLPPPPPPGILSSESVSSNDVGSGTAATSSLASPQQKQLAPATPELEDKAKRMESPLQPPKDAPSHLKKPPSPASAPPTTVTPLLMEKTARRTTQPPPPPKILTSESLQLAPAIPKLEDRDERMSRPSQLPNIASTLEENVSHRIVTAPQPPSPPPLPFASSMTASPPITSLMESDTVGTKSHTQASTPHQPKGESLPENEGPRTGSPLPPPPPLPSQPGIKSSTMPPPPPNLHPSTPNLIESSPLKYCVPAPPPPPPVPTLGAPQPAPPPPPPMKDNSAFTGGSIPPPPPPPFSPMKKSSAPGGGPPPPPAPSMHSGPTAGHSSSSGMPLPPPPPMAPVSAKNGSSSVPSAPPPPMPAKGNTKSNGPVAPPPSAPPPGGKRSMLSRTVASKNSQAKKLKPLHWLKLTRAVQGSLWAEAQKSGEYGTDIDMSELEILFSAAVPTSDGRKGDSRNSLKPKPEKVQLIDHRRAYNCEIMLSKVKIPLPDLLSSVLALEDSALDVDQVDNLIKFCPTKEEMELLKGYNGEREKLGRCEQFFLELMQVPRIEQKLRVFSFKIQFHAQVSELQKNLNAVNSAADQIRSSAKLKRIMQTILSLGNALNQGTARGSAVGFRLDSLLKLTETRARNNKMTLMHYLCKVLADKLPELLDFSIDLSSLEPASKIQLKFLAEEMQAINKGLEKVIQELSMSKNDGHVSENFCKALTEFLSYAEGEVRSLASSYSGVGRNVDALILYFGEDPTRCPFEQVVSTILNFVKMFNKSHEENCKQIEFEKKKAEKEAAAEKAAEKAADKAADKVRLNASGNGTEHMIPSAIRS